MMVLREFRWLRVSLVWAAFLGAPALMGAQCGDTWNKIKDNANIQFSIQRSIDLDLNVDEFVAGQNIPTDGSGRVPKGSPPIKIPVEIPAKNIDLSDHPSIQAHGSKVRHVRPKSIKVHVEKNTANIDIPRIDVFMGTGGSFRQIGYLSGIAKGKSGQYEDIIKDPNAADAFSAMFLKYKFDLQAKTELIVKEGQEVPKGKIKLRIAFDLEFSVNPFK